MILPSVAFFSEILSPRLSTHISMNEFVGGFI